MEKQRRGGRPKTESARPVLVADIGNTFAKIALVRGPGSRPRVLALPTATLRETDVLASLPAFPRGFAPLAVVGNVSFPEKGDLVASAVRRKYGVDAYRLTAETKYPFAFRPGICVAEVGDDLKALTAYSAPLAETVVAFSFGTASVALLIHKNTLMGAAIAPGLAAGIKALRQTIAAPWDPKDVRVDGCDPFGADTVTALEAGAMHVRCGFITNVLMLASAVLRVPERRIEIVACGQEAFDEIAGAQHAPAVLFGYRAIALFNLCPPASKRS